MPRRRSTRPKRRSARLSFAANAAPKRRLVRKDDLDSDDDSDDDGAWMSGPKRTGKKKVVVSDDDDSDDEVIKVPAPKKRKSQQKKRKSQQKRRKSQKKQATTSGIKVGDLVIQDDRRRHSDYAHNLYAYRVVKVSPKTFTMIQSAMRVVQAAADRYTVKLAGAGVSHATESRARHTDRGWVTGTGRWGETPLEVMTDGKYTFTDGYPCHFRPRHEPRCPAGQPHECLKVGDVRDSIQVTYDQW